MPTSRRPYGCSRPRPRAASRSSTATGGWWGGLPVRAFSIGMGPVIARWRWQETEWRLSLLPLGGYVDLPGMTAKLNEDGSLAHPDDGLAVRPLHHKLWVLVGGVVANYALGIVLLAVAVVLAPTFREVVTGEAPNVRGTVVAGGAAGSAAGGA